MNVPKWLLPVIASVAAIAVGVAALLVGIRFAPVPDGESVAIDPETVTVPVIEPVTIGDDGPSEVVSGDGLFDVGDAVGEITVSTELPADIGVAPIEAAVREILDGGAAADAAADAPPASDDPLTRLIDPCILSDEGCPEPGVRSRVFALTALPPFDISLLPAVYAPECPPLAEGEVGGTIRLNHPTTSIEVQVRTIDAGAIIAETTATIPPPVLAAFEEERRFDTPSEELPFLYACYALDGLPDATSFRIAAHATSVDGSEASDVRSFSTGTPDEDDTPSADPGITLELVGQHAVVAYAPYRDDQAVVIRAQVLDDIHTPDCDSPGETLSSVYSSAGPISHVLHERLNLPDGYDNRRATGFRVPEGSTVVFCATWLRGGVDAPSWERDDVLFSDGAFIDTQDLVVPQLTVTAAEVTDDARVARVQVGARTAEGMSCGGLRLRPDTSPIPGPLCTLDASSTDFSAATMSFTDVGFSGDLVVRSTIEASGERITSEVVIPGSAGVCAGICPRPPSEFYTIPLPGFRTGSGLCGSSFGADCEPPTRETSAGYVVVRLDWAWGATNGMPRTIVYDLDAPSAEDDVAAVADFEPQFDTDARIEYLGIDIPTSSARVGLDLRTDRPVDYVVSLRSLRPGETPCAVGGASLVATGRSAGDTRVEFPGACFGTMYWATVTLTDDAGRRSTWTGPGGSHAWLGSLLRVPTVELTLMYAVRHEVPAGSAIATAAFTIDGQPLAPINGTGTCADGLIASEGEVVVEVGSRPFLELDLEIAPTIARAGDLCIPDRRSRTSLVGAAMYLDLASMIWAETPTRIVVGGLTLDLVFVAG